MAMAATMTDPLSTPEIMLLVADHLSLHDLTLCARVCRHWRDTFAYRIWEHTTICARSEDPSFPSLQKALKHAAFVRNLTVENFHEWKYSERNYFWVAFCQLSILRALTFRGRIEIDLPVTQSWFESLHCQLCYLTCLDLDPFLAFTCEMYAEILTRGRQLKILRGGTCNAKGLTEGKPWACHRLVEWTLCLDFGSLKDYQEEEKEEKREVEKRTRALATNKQALEEHAQQKLEDVYRRVFQRMSALRALEKVDLSLRNARALRGPLCITSGKGIEQLLGQPLLRSLKVQGGALAASEIDWFRTSWPRITVEEVVAPVDPTYFFCI
ncbi:hypothetical protein EMPS_07071 [Entomortierella parvispora]|uniref:F-box domain-containing protein n=1 Tax=Entomortierella parvispora TaxID=205924 RepID=A0A9P3HDX1_9FUNG|nr:hypothetical protein EMPS_07071 [Entomortierella parvispora]